MVGEDRREGRGGEGRGGEGRGGGEGTIITVILLVSYYLSS